jgi:hypothetical protein
MKLLEYRLDIADTFQPLDVLTIAMPEHTLYDLIVVLEKEEAEAEFIQIVGARMLEIIKEIHKERYSK